MGRPRGQDLEAENELLRAQLEAIHDQVGDLLEELDAVEREHDEDDEEPEE